MNLIQLKKTLKAKVKPLGRRVQIMHPWELFKLRYEKHLEIRFNDSTYIIKYTNNDWKVYNVQRNKIEKEWTFTQESESCEYLNKIINRVL